MRNAASFEQRDRDASNSSGFSYPASSDGSLYGLGMSGSGNSGSQTNQKPMLVQTHSNAGEQKQDSAIAVPDCYRGVLLLLPRI